MPPRVVKPPSGFKRKKCPRCLATIEYAPVDVQERHGRDMSGGADGEKFIRCPNTDCGHKIVLESW